MIQVKNISKQFDRTKALDHVSFDIERGNIYGLVGANGAGKSTILRIIAGVYRPDEGEVEIDGIPVYGSVAGKEKMVFVADELYFLRGASLNRMKKLYKSVFPNFDEAFFQSLAELFQLDRRKSLHSLSKGMKRQAAIVLALSCRPEYLLLDETFDGLDPVMRNLVRSIVYKEVEERKMTVLLSSHSLRELEGLCDQLALLYRGGLIFERDITDLKTSLFKVQIAFDHDYGKEEFEKLQVLKYSRQGTVSSLVVRGDQTETVDYLKEKRPVILEVVPLSLEEVFTYELGAMGYQFDPQDLEKGAAADEK